MSEPILLSMIFADRVIVENNNKKGIIGTFDRFMSSTFPAIFPPWAIYVAVTNLTGKHNFSITLTQIETGNIILPINGELESPNQDQNMELFFNLAGIAFPEPGRYSLSVELDGELLGSRVLFVEQISPAS